MEYVVRAIIVLSYMLIVAIVIRTLLSWFTPDPNNFFVSVVHSLTEWILAPLRRIVPRFGMIDLSPMVAIIMLYVVIILLQMAIS